MVKAFAAAPPIGERQDHATAIAAPPHQRRLSHPRRIPPAAGGAGGDLPRSVRGRDLLGFH
jgi:hypothetical protein